MTGPSNVARCLVDSSLSCRRSEVDVSGGYAEVAVTHRSSSNAYCRPGAKRDNELAT